MSKELKAVRLTREIKELEIELTNHQEKCKHKKATCDKSDSYHVWKCPTCLKRWTISSKYCKHEDATWGAKKSRRKEQILKDAGF